MLKHGHKKNNLANGKKYKKSTPVWQNRSKKDIKKRVPTPFFFFLLTEWIHDVYTRAII